jgi:hypothetical protein
MKKKGGGRKKTTGVSTTKAAGSTGTLKKKKTSAKHNNNNHPEFPDLEEETPFDQRKAPHEIMPLLVPHTRRNVVCFTRTALPEPPTHVYILPVLDNCNPLNHTSPHNHPPASFVEAAERAVSSANALEDDDEEEGVNLKCNLVGEERSGLDDLSYSSAEDDEAYDDDMEEAACQIEYSNSNRIRHGRRQTNFIPGGPKPPTYDGMNTVEQVMAKQEYKKEQKQFTDGLRMKRLQDQNDNYNKKAFSGCSTLAV